MEDTRRIQMKLNVGGTVIQYDAPFDRQDFIRDVESSIKGLYDTWRTQYPSRTDRQIMAMVAFQFASFYLELKEREQKATDKIEECMAMLRDLDGNEAVPESEDVIPFPELDSGE